MNSDELVIDQYLAIFREHLDDPDITEILINKPGEFVYLSNKNKGWTVVADSRITDNFLRVLIQLTAAYNHMAISDVMSVRFPKGERVQIASGSAVEPGFYAIAIRKHVDVAFSFDQLLAQGAFDVVDSGNEEKKTSQSEQINTDLSNFLAQKQYKNFFETAIKANKNILVAGKTGSGKTTIMRTLIDMIPLDCRIITIEDVHELKMERHINKTHLIFGRGEGRISATEQLANCMRLSPDRILLAEMRGNEAWDYIQSLLSGHPGSISSVHSNSAMDTFDRVAGFLLQSPAGSKIPYESLVEQVKRVIDIIVYVSNRKVLEIYFNK